MIRRFFCEALLLLVLAAQVWGYVHLTANGQRTTWASGYIPIRLSMGPSGPVLSDGMTANASVEAAVRVWNLHLGAVQFAPERTNSSAAYNNDNVNEVAFAGTHNGLALGANTLAVTLAYRDTTPRVDGSYRTIEADVVFNSAKTWDSYRGPQRESVYDIRRVALHELGHVLGLDHPDEASPPQIVSAQMNSAVSNLDDLMADDITGAQSLYGAPGVVTRPANDDFAKAALFTLANGSRQVMVSNIWATKQRFEPNHSYGESGGASVWWRWLAPSSGSVTVNTTGSNFDTLLAVYIGTAVNQLTRLADNDDASSSVRTSAVSFTSVVGTTYYIAVDGWAADTGTISLELQADAVTTAPEIISTPTASVGVGNAFSYQVTTTSHVTSYGLIGTLPSGLTFDGATGIISGRPLVTGIFPLTLSATNTLGSDTGELTLTVTDAPPAIWEQTTGWQGVELGGGITLAASGFSANGAISYQWIHDGHPIAGATAPSLVLSNLGLRDRGFYWVQMTNGIGSSYSDAVYVRMQGAAVATQVRAWGNAGDGRTAVPAGLSDAVAFAAGGTHAIALRADGALVGWGRVAAYQPLPVAAEGFAAVATGGSHNMGLLPDGTVVVWGESLPAVPAGLKGVVAVAAGWQTCFALKADGTVVAWGVNNFNQLGVPAGLNNVAAIAAGESFALALKRDGTVVGWGYNTYGQTNVPTGLMGVTAIAAGTWHSVALRNDGTVVTWGGNTPSQIKVPTGLGDVTAIAAGAWHSLALKTDGTVVGWGLNDTGEATPPAELTDVLAIKGGNRFSLALVNLALELKPQIVTQPLSATRLEREQVAFSVNATGPGVLSYQWRKNGGAITGATLATLSLDNLTTADSGSYDVIVSNYIGATVSEAVVLTVNLRSVITPMQPTHQVVTRGEALDLGVNVTGSGPFSYQWYHNGLAIEGGTGSTVHVPSAAAGDAGYYFVTVTDSEGMRRSMPMFVAVAPVQPKVIVWGQNLAGQTQPPAGLIDVIGVAAGTFHMLALKRDGTAMAWGYNSDGQANVPADLDNIVEIGAGPFHNVVLRDNGTVFDWGSSNAGVGNRPAGLTDVVAVAAGNNHSLALKSDGTVTGWGANGFKQTTIPLGLSQVVAIAAGGEHSLALKSDGSVVGWGRNDYGQINIPAAALSDVVAVAAGGNHTLALKRNGSVLAWGFNGFGQTNIPAGLTNVVKIAAAGNHSLAIKANGAVAVWGENGLNQATPPAEMPKARALAGGGSFSIALCDLVQYSMPLVTGQPASQVISVGAGVAFTAGVSGSPAPSCQWQVNRNDGHGWVNLEEAGSVTGTLSVSLSIAGVTRAMNGYRYRLMAINAEGSVTSDEAMLTVLATFSGWRMESFEASELGDASISGPNADSDGDGLANLLEYALGLEPKIVDASDLPEVSIVGEEWVYRYSRPADRSDISYEVQMSSNLTDWSAVGTQEKVTMVGFNEQWQARVPLSTANVFFRLKVTQTE